MISCLIVKRLKAAKSKEERAAWLQLNDAYMTEESESETEGIINHHKLTWTSDSTLTCIIKYNIKTHCVLPLTLGIRS